MKHFIATVLGTLLLMTSSAAQTATLKTATLKMRFVYDGEPPAAKYFDFAAAWRAGAGPIIDESLLVDPESKGIKNVIVYAYSGRAGTRVKLESRAPKTHRLVMENGSFFPRVLITQAGDTLELVDGGPNVYSPNILFLKNSQDKSPVAPGKSKIMKLDESEPAAVPVYCDNHPWMKSHLLVLDHPFAGCSDKQGRIEIKDLPANAKVIFKVFHEANGDQLGSLESVKINGAWTNRRRYRFEIDLLPGINDLGDVLVPTAH